ncbi:hypothetical protein AB0J82_28395 [Asanoa sp. NPDC049518]
MDGLSWWLDELDLGWVGPASEVPALPAGLPDTATIGGATALRSR